MKDRLFDLFKLEPDGNVLWIGLAGTMEEAELQIRELGALESADYLIFCQTTGSKTVIRNFQMHKVAEPD